MSTSTLGLKVLHQLEHPLEVCAVSFSPDGKTLASGGMGKSRPFLEQLLKAEGNPKLPKPAENPSAVRLWDVATGKLLHTLEGHQQFIASLSFSPDGKILASGSLDRTIRLWDVAAGRELRKLNGTLDFGTVRVGVANAKNFTVKNTASSADVEEHHGPER